MIVRVLKNAHFLQHEFVQNVILFVSQAGV